MAGSVFFETLRRGWRPALYWGIGIALLAGVTMLIIPDVDALQQFTEVFANLPPVLQQIAGLDDAAAMATPEGFIGTLLFTRVVLMIAIYAVLAGMSVTSNDEEAGILDSVLALPLARTRLLVDKLLAHGVLAVFLMAVVLVGLVIANSIATLKVDVSLLAASIVSMLPLLLVMLGMTVLAGAFFRRRAQAVGAATLVIVGMYFIDLIGAAATDTVFGQLRPLSVWSYYDSMAVMQTGIAWGNVALLSAVTVLCAVGALWAFSRRDVGG